MRPLHTANFIISYLQWRGYWQCRQSLVHSLHEQIPGRLVAAAWKTLGSAAAPGETAVVAGHIQRTVYRRNRSPH